MTKPSIDLGRLRRVEARDIWEGEASHFTPWLARVENLDLLGETVGIELELEAQEKDVGPFRADLLCKDLATGEWVLVENQLERTDHTHLGQLLTYASGLKAVTIIWVANRFTEEHRAALDWLNEITDERFNFFGLEVEVWRIGESRPAPKFNVVSKPNDWSRSVAQAASRAELTDSKELQLSFWTAFRSFAESQSTSIRPTKPLPQHWMSIAIGRTGFGLSAIASLWDSENQSYDSHEVRVELVIGDDRAKEYLALLGVEREQIEHELGYPVEWYSKDDVKMCKVHVRRGADLNDEAGWGDLHAWLLEHLEDFDRVFRARIRGLSLGEGV